MANVIWNHENADHRRAFALVLAPLISVLWKKSYPFGVVEARTYMRTLKHVPNQVLVEAAAKAIAEDKWFPEPSVLLDYAAEIVAAQHRAIREKWNGHCEHPSGFQEIVVDGVKRLRRCECRERMAREIAQIGSPIQRPRPRLTLPEHIE